ncbi:MAG: cell division protein FtsX [Paludibacter sp. 47-17]|nr:MAG: cell division protein FtsX [Paludibacter sp. SCN 51-9]OJX91698.1 MAG: cell division protein FtsX [Paludibacter sp. 47-17]
MTEEKEKKQFSIRNIHMTSTLSMSMVLFMIGMVVLLIFVAQEMSTRLRENISMSLILRDEISSTELTRIQQYLDNSPFTKESKFISKDDALNEHIASLGEDPSKFLGFNPLMASIEVKLVAGYATVDSVEKIESKLRKFTSIDRVAYQKDIVALVNDNIARISVLLLGVAVVLLLISIALINNTIKVSIYANRFLINTMKLVGATPWFIRKPYMIRGMINGFLASVISLSMLGLLMLYIARETDINLFTLSTGTLVAVAVIVIVLGQLLTAISSYLAVGRYLRMQTNDMYFV